METISKIPTLEKQFIQDLISSEEDLDFTEDSFNYNFNKRIKELEAQANQSYELAKTKLESYMPIVQKVLTNGFQEISKPGKERIINNLGNKIQDIASSTGLISTKVDDLTQEYIGKITIISNLPYLFN